MSGPARGTARGLFGHYRSRNDAEYIARRHRAEEARTQIEVTLADAEVFSEGDGASAIVFGATFDGGVGSDYYIERVASDRGFLVSPDVLPQALTAALLPLLEQAEPVGSIEWERGDGQPTLLSLDLNRTPEPARRFVGYDRISKKGHGRQAAERVAREGMTETFAAADLAPHVVVFARTPRTGHGFDLTIDHIVVDQSTHVPGHALDEDLAFDILGIAVLAMPHAELAWKTTDAGTQQLLLSLTERDAPTRDTKPEDETDVVRIVLYRDHGHFGDRDTLPPGFTRCRTCDRRAEKVTTALRRFREGRR